RPAWDEDAWNYDRPRLSGAPPANDYYNAPPSPPRYQPEPYAPRGDAYAPRRDDPYRPASGANWEEPPAPRPVRPPEPGYRPPESGYSQPPAPERGYGAPGGRPPSGGEGYRTPPDPWGESERPAPRRRPDEPARNRPPEAARPPRSRGDRPPRDPLAARPGAYDAPQRGYNSGYDDDWGDEDEWL
ncbi:MAG TPA: hypothetical protein V6D02_17210, partial [Candidatus Obscuribacterales bacterium]